ncbi:MAG: MarR family transcriptional regulator, partial [Planctomycetes bacterium]|nr:MarR family transcriptional regulator [Planctomycetota bacterium]
MKSSTIHRTERLLVAEAERRIREHLFRSFKPLKLGHPARARDLGVDFVLTAGKSVFHVQLKSNAQYATVHRAIEQLRQGVQGRKALALLGVPHMPPASAELCAREGVSWFDLSGNADIAAPGLLVEVKGRPNLHRRRGRPPSVFAPKSSRIARALLAGPGRLVRQQDLAQETGLDPGYVSRIVKRLVEAGFVARGTDGAIRVAAPRALLDGWRAENPFAREQVERIHVAARGGEETLSKLAEGLRRGGTAHAFTGLAAAWVQAPFAMFRVATVYLDAPVTDEMIESLGGRRVESGANVWLVSPRDTGVFDGAQDVHGVRCVHAVQTYVDLAGHPE